MTTATSTQNLVKTAQKPTLASSIRMQQEMMIMRETDQWMAEHYKSRQ